MLELDYYSKKQWSNKLNLLIRRLKISACLAMLLSCAVSSKIAMAESRALLIGVGEYERGQYNLPGIDVDISIMREIAGKLGYRDDQIKELQNSEVTRENLIRTIETWLIDGVGPDDKALVYFSGHGSQLKDDNGDEEDGYDETITLYELNTPGAIDGGMLRDDDLGQLLARIPSKSTALMIDACCSGTASKSIQLGVGSNIEYKTQFRVKSAGCPSSRQKSLPDSAGFLDKAFGVEAAAGSAASVKPSASAGSSTAGSSTAGPSTAGRASGKIVYLSAAQDTQESLAGRDGSVFTLALKAAFEQDRELTPDQLKTFATSHIASTVPPHSVFSPNLTGDSDLLNLKSLYVVETQPQQPVVLRQWNEIVGSGEGQAIRMLSGPSSFSEGQNITLDIEMPFEGYVNVISVDANDNARVMYPNAYTPESKLHPRSFLSLPEGGANWVAQAPHGDTHFFVVVTREPLNFHAKSHDYQNGQPLASFLSPSVAQTRALSRSENKANQNIDYRAGKITVSTCASGC